MENMEKPKTHADLVELANYFGWAVEIDHNGQYVLYTGTTSDDDGNLVEIL